MPGLYKYIPYKPSLQYQAISGRKENEDPLVRAWIKGQIPALRESVEAEKAFEVEEASRAEQKRQFGENIDLRKKGLALTREQQIEEERQGRVSMGLTGASTIATGAALTKGTLWGKAAAPGLAVNAPEAAGTVGGGGTSVSGGGATSWMPKAGYGHALGLALEDVGSVKSWDKEGGKEYGLRSLKASLIGQTAYQRGKDDEIRSSLGMSDDAAAVFRATVLGNPLGAWAERTGALDKVFGGCIVFGYLYGDKSPQARYAKVFCGRYMDLSTLLGYYQLGEKMISFWEKHPSFIKPMKRLLVMPFYDYMLWKLKRKKKISLWAKVWSKCWLKLCKETEKRRKEPMFVPAQYNPCIQVVGGNHA